MSSIQHAHAIASELQSIFKHESVKNMVLFKKSALIPASPDEKSILIYHKDTYKSQAVILRTAYVSEQLIGSFKQEQFSYLSPFKRAAYKETMDRVITLIEQQYPFVQASIALCEPDCSNNLANSRILQSRVYLYTKSHLLEPRARL